MQFPAAAGCGEVVHLVHDSIPASDVIRQLRPELRYGPNGSFTKPSVAPKQRHQVKRWSLLGMQFLGKRNNLLLKTFKLLVRSFTWLAWQVKRCKLQAEPGGGEPSRKSGDSQSVALPPGISATHLRS